MTYEEIKANRDKAYQEFIDWRNEFDKTWDFSGKSYGEYSKAVHSSREYITYCGWDSAERLNRVPTMRPISFEWENDCKMTLDDFLETIKLGYITDWDGSGYYGNENEVSDIGVDIEQMRKGKYRRDFTHIWWYNK